MACQCHKLSRLKVVNKVFQNAWNHKKMTYFNNILVRVLQILLCIWQKCCFGYGLNCAYYATSKNKHRCFHLWQVQTKARNYFLRSFNQQESLYNWLWPFAKVQSLIGGNLDDCSTRTKGNVITKDCNYLNDH